MRFLRFFGSQVSGRRHGLFHSARVLHRRLRKLVFCRLSLFLFLPSRHMCRLFCPFPQDGIEIDCSSINLCIRGS